MCLRSVKRPKNKVVPLTDAIRWTFGQVLYLRVQPDEAGMVVGIILEPGAHLYKVSWGNGSTTAHYEYELTEEDRGYITA